jgi:hypothetical protein
VAIVGGLGLNAIVAFVPGAYDAWCRLVTDRLTLGVVRAVFVGGMAAHVVEAVHAYRLARSAGFDEAARGWFVQTLALGGPSLAALRRRIAAME